MKAGGLCTAKLRKRPAQSRGAFIKVSVFAVNLRIAEARRAKQRTFSEQAVFVSHSGSEIIYT